MRSSFLTSSRTAWWLVAAVAAFGAGFSIGAALEERRLGWIVTSTNELTEGTKGCIEVTRRSIDMQRRSAALGGAQGIEGQSRASEGGATTPQY